MLTKAIELAEKCHAGQKWGIYPYVVHLARVEDILVGFGFSSETYRISAWLHDILEDTPVTAHYLDVVCEFPPDVIELVSAVSDPQGVSREEAKRSVYEKIRKYPEALPLKLADRITNVEMALAFGPQRFVDLYTREHHNGFSAMMLDARDRLCRSAAWSQRGRIGPMCSWMDYLINSPQTLPPTRDVP